MFRHILLIANPSTRSFIEGHDWQAELVEKLSKVTNYAISVFHTTPETGVDDLVNFLRPPLDLIIAAGGDGTIRFAFAALAKSKMDIPIAVLPLGTGNVLARNLGIVSENFFADPLEKAIDSIVNGVPHPMDLGLMNGRYFTGMAGAGPLAEAFTSPAREEKSRLKMFAYVGSMLETIASPPLRFRIATPESTFDVEASGVFVGNVDDLGFGTPTDIATLADGYLNLTILSPRGFEDYVNMGFRFVGGEAEGQLPLHVRSVEEVIIDVADSPAPRTEFQELARAVMDKLGASTDEDSNQVGPLKAMIDGEIYGTTPMYVKVVPHAVKVIVPKDHALISSRPWLASESDESASVSCDSVE